MAGLPPKAPPKTLLAPRKPQQAGNENAEQQILKAGSALGVQAATLPVYGSEASIQGTETVEYLQKWASQGTWEKKQLVRLQRLQKEAIPAMQAYYQRQFNLTPEQAEQSAHYYIIALQDYYLGRFSK